MARIRYDAFISYRHGEPDSEIAARLHEKLESFRLPKTVAAKIRKTRLHRVFVMKRNLPYPTICRKPLKQLFKIPSI